MNPPLDQSQLSIGWSYKNSQVMDIQDPRQPRKKEPILS
jgi:hypothetical protein